MIFFQMRIIIKNMVFLEETLDQERLQMLDLLSETMIKSRRLNFAEGSNWLRQHNAGLHHCLVDPDVIYSQQFEAMPLMKRSTTMTKVFDNLINESKHPVC